MNEIDGLLVLLSFPKPKANRSKKRRQFHDLFTFEGSCLIKTIHSYKTAWSTSGICSMFFAREENEITRKSQNQKPQMFVSWYHAAIFILWHWWRYGSMQCLHCSDFTSNPARPFLFGLVGCSHPGSLQDKSQNWRPCPSRVQNQRPSTRRNKALQKRRQKIPVEITQEDLCHQFVVTTRVLTTCALTERPAPLPPQSLTQRYHRSRVSIKKGLLQKGHDHMLWSKITTHYLQSCTVWVDLAIAFCRHNCLNKSYNATLFWTFSFVQQVFFGCKGAHSLVKTCLCLRILYKLTWISLQDPPSQIPCSCKNMILRFQLLRESIFSSCMHSVPFKNMYVGLTKRPWSLTEFGRLAKKEYCCYKETVHSPFFPLHICTENHSVEHTSHPFL